VHLDVRVPASPFGVSRIGIVVPKHHHSAVERNRLKRRLRELVRLELLPLIRSRAVDVAIRARREAYDSSFDLLRRDIHRIVDHLTTTASGQPTPRETSA
jgi:ribonuclease P protein component